MARRCPDWCGGERSQAILFSSPKARSIRLFIFGNGRLAVIRVQLQTLFWANLDTITAGNALQPFNAPLFGGPIYRQGIGRAFLGAYIAINAIILDKYQLAPAQGQGTTGHEGVLPGDRRLDGPFEGQFGHGKICHTQILNAPCN